MTHRLYKGAPLAGKDRCLFAIFASFAVLCVFALSILSYSLRSLTSLTIPSFINATLKLNQQAQSLVSKSQIRQHLLPVNRVKRFS